ncbi:MAG: type II secretion system protein [Phycisphaerae bacterium]|nr:type II secretion system protein [Phycisphaerae bacterium]
MRHPTSNTQHATYDIRDTSKPAFTLVELLVALAITAILLTAIAVAFNASVINYRENENIFKAINGARQALFRITGQLRVATGVDPNSPENECAMITAGGDDITYRYDDTEKVLYLITNPDTTNDDYVLCRNVEAMTFTKNFTPEGDVRSVQIVIDVASGGVVKKIAAAAVVRRTLD